MMATTARYIYCLCRLSRNSSLFRFRENDIFTEFHTRKALLSTSTNLHYDDMRSAERSWVKKMLYGSGPSAEIEELEETAVQVEPHYMEILQEKAKETFIERPGVRKKVYQPPENLEDEILAITQEICRDVEESNWQETPINDNKVKFEILSRCFNAFNHDVPNFRLDQMATVGDIISFYQEEVKDTTKFDELSTLDLPKNLKIHWEYNDDSQLELYEEYLNYVRKNNPGPPPKNPYRTLI